MMLRIPWCFVWQCLHASGRDDFEGRTLFVTMVGPGDKVPAPLMLVHQLRMLARRMQSIGDVVVLDNWPDRKDHTGSTEAIARLAPQGLCRFRQVDQRRIEDEDFLGRFLRLGQEKDRSSSVRPLVRDWRPERRLYLTGMLHFLEECSTAQWFISLCIFVDSDILLYRHKYGMADLAHSIFRHYKDFVILSPPTVCHSHISRDAGSGRCGVHRYFRNTGPMIVHRHRLVMSLPWQVRPSDFQSYPTLMWPHASWSNMLSSVGRRNNWLGWMTCGNETFAIHPERGLDAEQPLHTALLIKRLEDGRFERPAREEQGRMSLFRRASAPFSNWSTWREAFKAAYGEGGDVLTTNMCLDIYTSARRLASGLAW
eukprot:TRINITY_DN36341_c0_g1_i3.p1 TRINITY_DN36341_c0_g1~~TRINITY_DN36341_c0_g1_i3.p1  ORF type:complete len:369 (+),score=0.94 TRINITY_DN36341_c0_g1_i3:314-1420(+)